MFPRLVEGVEAVSGEDVGGDDAAEVAPVVAVRRGVKAGVVVEEVLPCEEAWAVCQNGVVSGEASLC